MPIGRLSVIEKRYGRFPTFGKLVRVSRVQQKAQAPVPASIVARLGKSAGGSGAKVDLTSFGFSACEPFPNVPICAFRQDVGISPSSAFRMAIIGPAIIWNASLREAIRLRGGVSRFCVPLVPVVCPMRGSLGMTVRRRNGRYGDGSKNVY